MNDNHLQIDTSLVWKINNIAFYLAGWAKGNEINNEPYKHVITLIYQKIF